MNALKTFISKLDRKYLLCALSGTVCAALQSTVSVPFAALVCYMPMMYSLSRYSCRRDFLKAFLSFFLPYYFYQLVFLVAVYPQIDMHRGIAVTLLVAAVLILTLWETLLMLLPVSLFPALRRDRAYDVAALSILIAGGEWLQESFPVLSFPWSSVWLSVTDSPVLLQSANLLGCRIVTVTVLCINGFLALSVVEKKRVVPIAAAAAVVAVSLGYGTLSIRHLKSVSQASQDISVVIAQDESEGRKKTIRTAGDCAGSYKGIIKSSAVTKADLVIFPETAVPMEYDSGADEFCTVEGIAKSVGATVVNGCFYSFDGDEYNAVYAVDEKGSVSEPYFKQVLVPFGEKIPLAFLFGAGTLSECSDEQHTKPLETQLGKIGCAICIESIYPATVKKQASQGAQILCVCTNDSWFGGSYAREMHFRHSIMRAAENGKFLLRSGNCGISALIMPTGEVGSIRTDTSKGVVTGKASLIDEQTFYSCTGDLFAVLPASLAAAAIIRIYRNGRDSR